MAKQTNREKVRALDRILANAKASATTYDLNGVTVKISRPSVEVFSRAQWAANLMASKDLEDYREEWQGQPIDEVAHNQTVEKAKEKGYEDRITKPKDLWQQRVEAEAQTKLVLVLGSWLLTDEEGERLAQGKEDEEVLRGVIAQDIELIKLIGKELEKFTGRVVDEVEGKQ